MKFKSHNLIAFGVFIVFINSLFAAIGLSQSSSRQAYEAYYLKLNPYPVSSTHDWHPNGTEIQGVTHDDANWYFTTTDYDGGNARLWRIPVSVPLEQNVLSVPGVGVVMMLGVPPLAGGKYNHWGDPDHYRYNGIDYIIVPITSGSNLPPIIAVFRANNLSLAGYGILPGGADGNSQTDVGWCAIIPNGDLITSNDDTNILFHYNFDWGILPSSGYIAEFPLTWKETHQLMDAQSTTSLFLHNMQGGEFTPSGELLYISCGSGECMGFGHGRFDTDGIHVFDTVTWSEIKRSVNSVRGETGYFNYTFDNGCTCGTGTQTPEGLTIWDLDDGRAPYVTGQLHVLVNFYNRYATCDDEISMQHFRGRLNVGWVPFVIQQTGTPWFPFHTIGLAFSYYPVWDGAEILIMPGTYLETGVFSTRVRLESLGGSVIIRSGQTNH